MLRFFQVIIQTSYINFLSTGISILLQVKTNKHLLLIIGVNQRAFPMSRVSDSPLLPSEFHDYVNYLKNNRLQAELLSKREASKMKDVQEKLVTNYHYTEQDIDEAVKAKKALTTTVANIGGEKMRAALAVQAAQQNVDESRSKVDEITKNFLEVFDDREKTDLEKELIKEKKSLSENLLTLQKCMEEEKKILAAEESRKNRMKQSTKIQNWVKVNERAKAANKNADVEAYKIELERMSHGGKEKEFDPFARRKVRPQILWDVGKDKSKDNDQNLENADAKKSEGTGLLDADNTESKNSGPHDPTETTIGQAAKNPKLKHSDELHDLAIDEELIARGNIQQGNGHSNKGSSLLGRVRKGLSLDEYLMKKAAGTL
jgi:RNA polymerase-associated protein RTF1